MYIHDFVVIPGPGGGRGSLIVFFLSQEGIQTQLVLRQPVTRAD